MSGSSVLNTTVVKTATVHTIVAAWTQTHTLTTSVLVPYSWLDRWQNGIVDYEALAKSKGANEMAFWESYVAGCDPTNASSRFLITNFVMSGTAVTMLKWIPDYETVPEPWTGKLRVYEVWGKTNLTDAVWVPTNSATRFFRVKVSMPEE